MPRYHFGRKDEPANELIQSPDLIAVRTRSRRSVASRTLGVAHPAADAVLDGVLVAAFPDAGVEVYRVPPADDAGMTGRKRSLRADPDVRFAGSVLMDPDSGEPVLYTENLFVKFFDQVEPET